MDNDKKVRLKEMKYELLRNFETKLNYSYT